jgi:chromosome segregation ATPase
MEGLNMQTSLLPKTESDTRSPPDLPHNPDGVSLASQQTKLPKNLVRESNVDLTERLTQQRMELTTLQGSYDSKVVQLADASQAIETLKKACGLLGQQVKSLTSEKAILISEKAVLTTEKENLSKQLKDAKEKNNDDTRSFEGKITEKERLIGEKDVLIKQKEGLIEEKTEEAKKMGEELKKEQDEVAEKNKEIERLNEETTKLEVEVTELKGQVKDLTSSGKTTQDALDFAKKEYDELCGVIRECAEQKIPELIRAKLSDTVVPEWKSAIPPELRKQLGLKD